MSAANFLISLGQTIDRSSSQSMTIIGMTAEAERVAVEAAGEFHFPEGVYANRYHYLFKIRNSRIFAGFEYFDPSVAARFFAGEFRSASCRESVFCSVLFLGLAVFFNTK